MPLAAFFNGAGATAPGAGQAQFAAVPQPQSATPFHALNTWMKTKIQMNALIAGGIVSSRPTPLSTGFKSMPAGIDANARPTTGMATNGYLPNAVSTPPTMRRAG